MPLKLMNDSVLSLSGRVDTTGEGRKCRISQQCSQHPAQSAGMAMDR